MFICTFLSIYFFFFNDTATTEIYTLSLHDALPISANADGFPFHSRRSTFTRRISQTDRRCRFRRMACLCPQQSRYRAFLCPIRGRRAQRCNRQAHGWPLSHITRDGNYVLRRRDRDDQQPSEP